MKNFTCPVCSSAAYSTIGKPKINNTAKEIVKRDYSIAQCKNCKLYSVAPTINFSKEEWKLLYNSEYFGESTPWLKKKREEELSERLSELEKNISGKELKLLDVGCGEGKTLIEASKKGWAAFGIDITDNRNSEAINDKITFYEGNLLELNLPSDFFDIVYLDSVLEHVINPLEYITEIKRLLKQGGLIYIGIPNEDSFFNYTRKIIFTLTGKKNISAQLKPFDNPYHVVGFNYYSISYLINKTGLKIISFKNVGRKFEFLSFKVTQRGFWINLFLVPVEFLGMILKKDVYFVMVLKK